MMPCALFLFALALASGLASAKESPSTAVDAAVEARVVAIAGELRCLVCQNQTLADSQADLAVDLRNQIRVQLKHGASDRQVEDFMVLRYGDFVLYRPPLKPATALLWFGPFGLMGVGVSALIYIIRRRSRGIDDAALTDAEYRRAAMLLDGRKGRVKR